MTPTDPMRIFDRRLVRLRRERAAVTVGRVFPVLDAAAERLLDRLDDTRRLAQRLTGDERATTLRWLAGRLDQRGGPVLLVADQLEEIGPDDARALVDLREVGVHAPLRVVVNRMRPTLGWTQRDVASMVGRFAESASLHFLPDDRAGVDRALVSGRTLVETAPDGPLPRALQPLADAVLSG